MTAREEELISRTLPADQTLIDVYLKERRWAEIAALIRYAKRDVPIELASTDPALYRTLREQITRFYINGGGVFSLPAVERLAANDSPTSANPCAPASSPSAQSRPR